MKVAYTYNVRRTTPELGKGHQPDLEFDDPMVIDTIAKAIEKCGHTVLRIEADDEAFLLVIINDFYFDFELYCC